MNTLQKIKRLAQQDKKKRQDPRYIRTMAFMTSKGFLFANRSFPKLPGLRLQVDDAIWAGKNVEPRILEVLPAAVLRLNKRFDFNPEKHAELAAVIEDIKNGRKNGRDFFGIPFERTLHWVGFDIKDHRIKRFGEKRVSRTFRFKPSTVDKIKKLAQAQKKNETAIIEELVSKI